MKKFAVILLLTVVVSAGFAQAPVAHPFLTPPQRTLLREVRDNTLTYFLSSQAVAPNGLIRTAYDADAPLSYGHANPAEWGYAMNAWIVAAESGKITVADAEARLNTALGTLEALRANPSESYQGLFYFLYDVFVGNVPLAQPHHWTPDAFIPSIDNGLLTLSIVVVEGWARQHSRTALANRAHAFWSTQNYRLFLTTLPNGRKALSHGFDPVAGTVTSGVWDVMADEGGSQTWVAYLTGSITLPEFAEITGGQKRWHGMKDGITVPEAAWFNVMFTWSVRALGGFPNATWETGIQNRYSESFAAAVKGHIAYANRKGYFYPALNDIMTQLYTARYVPPNLSGQESDFEHVNPPALVIPLLIGPELDPADVTLLLDKLAALKADTAGYYHAGNDGLPPFGFEVAASPYQNAVGYAGITSQGGRSVFETLSQIYFVGSIANALGIDSGQPTFCDFARYVPGYDAKLAEALGSLYPASFRVPQDFATVQSAIDSSIYGTVIEIAAGTYQENISIPKGITLRGSGGGVATPGTTGDDSIIDGGHLKQAVRIDNGFALSGVVLDGLTIRNGGPTDVSTDGSNVLIKNAQASVRRCWITGGRTHRGVGTGGYGASILARDGASVLIADNIIEDGQAWSGGGGIAVLNANAVIKRNTIRACSADNGGGIYLAAPVGGQVQILNNLILGNSTTYQDGGGLYIGAGNPQVANNTFVGNTAIAFTNGQGGAIYVEGAGASPVIIDNIFSANRANSGGAAVHCTGGAAPSRLEFNDAYLNTINGGATQNYSGCVPGAGSLTGNPLFVNAAAGDFHLGIGSPAINSGSGTDADGSVMDMGAFGGSGWPVTYSQWIGRYPSITGPASAANFDYDGDGISNRFEFLTGSNPAQRNPGGLFPMAKSPTGLTVRYQLNRLAGAASVQPEWSFDLIQWGALPAKETVTESGDLATVSLAIPTSGVQKVFFRLRGVTTP